MVVGQAQQANNGQAPAKCQVTFGWYPQKENGKPEPIEWNVLTICDGKALLLSKYGLDVKPYNSEDKNTTWEHCSLRKWLNGDFFNSAFSPSEQSKIQKTVVRDDINPDFGTNPGNPIRDKVFLLSISEAKKYVASDNDKKCEPTEYLKTNGADTYGGCCCWWLRSPGYYQHFAAFVFFDGSVRSEGLNINFDYFCVRPALWVRLNSQRFKSKILRAVKTEEEKPCNPPKGGRKKAEKTL